MTIPVLEAELHEAILLAAGDMPEAGRRLEEILARAIEADDGATVIACLKVLAVVNSVLAPKGERRVELCRELAKRDADNPSTWISLGDAEEGAGHRAEAAVAYQTAYALTRDQPTRELLADRLERLREPVQ